MDEEPAPRSIDATGEEPKPPVIDTSRAHPARVYDYWLGGKDNISQVVSALPYSDMTAAIHARHAFFSKIVSFAVRRLPVTCLGAYVRFDRMGVLTPS